MLNIRKQYAEWISVVIFSLWVCQVSTLIAYDCEDQGSDITAVSIRDVAECPEPEKEYTSTEIGIQVIQKNDIKLQKVLTCLVEVTRIMSYCGMHSHSSLVAGGISSFVYQIGKEECANVHRYKTLSIYQQQIGQIVMNGTTSASLTMVGQVDAAGRCKGVTYHEGGQSWENVYILATIRIQVQDYLAKVKLEENLLSLLGGVTCPFTGGHCFDTVLGETVWEDSTSTQCDDNLSLLHRGPATQVTNNNNQEKIIVVESSDKLFALSLMKRTILCNQEVWQTEHPRLVVVIGLINSYLQPKMQVQVQNTDLTSYVNSKFLYIEQSVKRNINRLYTDTVHRRCLVQREMLRNRLLMAPFAPHAISQTLKLDKGYVGRVLGEVLYVMRCVPKLVKIRRSNKCFHELPIEVDNKTMYMAPVTRIIQGHAEEVECNGLTPPLYYIDNEWVGLTPYPTIKNNPQQLTVDADPKLKFSPIQPVGQYGLYTQEEVSKVQQVLTFGVERKAVENIIARRVAGLEAGSQGFSTLKMFNPEEMKELAHSTMKQIWGWFTDIGMFFSGLIGFYTIFKILKYCIGVILNGFHLYETMGCGLSILASLWSTLATLLMHRRQWQTNGNPEETEITKVTVHDQASSCNQQKPSLYPALPTQHWTDQPVNCVSGEGISATAPPGMAPI